VPYRSLADSALAAATYGVFIMYEHELTTGDRPRNAEFITGRDGQLGGPWC
jgi:hypothetical protein